MWKLQRWQTGAAALASAFLMTACGGGEDKSAVLAPTPNPTPNPPVQQGAPALTGNVATDGLNWLNFRRSQLGVSVLARSTLIDSAAQNHSDYQRINNLVSHDEIEGKTGYTGVSAQQRLEHAGYTFSGGYAYGEVISASTSTSGVFLAEELITAIYHRFVIFEPRFKEIGSGSAANASGYNYFTTNFATTSGYGPGVAAGQLVTWPFDGQTGIVRNFMSDFESPDPVEDRNEVGYPVSVHANIESTLRVTSFTIKPRNGSNLNVKRLSSDSGDTHASDSVAAIVPLAALVRSTTYDVSFVGTVDGVPVSKTWSFTTEP